MPVDVLLDADDDSVAAALAAVGLYVADGHAEAAAARPRWQVAAVLAAHGMQPARASAPAWSGAERQARAARWSTGLLGAFD